MIVWKLLYDALKSAGVDATLRLVPKADHGSPELFAPDSLAAVDAFLARTLKREPRRRRLKK